ncbi:hypothetical protein LTS18_003717, partial [Coniosporium uncinatum]
RNQKLRAYENHDVDTPEGLKPWRIDPNTEICDSLPRRVKVKLEMRRKKTRGGEEPRNIGKAPETRWKKNTEVEEVTLALGAEDVHLEH